jgi:uncharacterized protein (TIGR03437 family)
MPLQVSVNAVGLAPGTYTGTIAVTSADTSTTAAAIVSLTVQAAPKPAIAAVKNAASYAGTAIAPGENVIIGGTGLGPVALAGSQLTGAGRLATTVAGTQILFGDTPAPIVYVSATQASVMVPYEVAGQTSVPIRVVYQSGTSDAFPVPVVASSAGIYTQNLTGSGQGAILNQDGVTLNSASAPAARDSVVAVYLTGEGVTMPPGISGAIAPSNGSGLNRPVLPVTATVGGVPAAVEYYGSAPGSPYGIMQVNVRIPGAAASGTQQIGVTVGGSGTQSGVTVAVQ